MSATVGLFPGQGVQSPGMEGSLVEAAPEVFEVASDAVGIDVAGLCRSGASGGATLDSTRWAQPAIVTVGVAASRVLERSGVRFGAYVGHSLGEYTALVAAGAVELGDALRLVAIRADAMDRAAAVAPGGMVAVMRLSLAEVERVCSESGVNVAGDNAPGQVVVSGPEQELDDTVSALEAIGGRCIRVDVSGAFHSPLMAPAVPTLEAALAATRFTQPCIAVWSPTLAAPLTEVEDIRRALLLQLTAPVRWRETILALTEMGDALFCDAGPGKVVSGLVRRTLPTARVEAAAALLEAARVAP